MDVRHYEVSSVAVFRRRSAVEVTQHAGHPISFTTRQRKMPIPAISIAVKAKAAAQVGDVINKFFDASKNLFMTSPTCAAAFAFTAMLIAGMGILRWRVVKLMG